MAIDLERIKSHLRFIAQPRDAFENPSGLAEVQDYLQEQLTSYGYEVQLYPFDCEGRSFANLIARKPGGPAFPEFIVGAHFDAVPGTPGADDNASGVAAMLEIARHAVPLPLSVQFAAFNLEEYNMIGSTAYVRFLKENMPQEAKKRFLGMISLEMIGFTAKKKGSQQLPLFLRPFYPDTGNFLALVGDNGSSSLLKTAETAFRKAGVPVQSLKVPLKGFEFPAVRLSDHSPFWDANFPALLVTDTSFFRNPHYHTAADTAETLDFNFLQKTAEGGLRLLTVLKSA